jgi:hypothetical protein
LVPVTVEGSLQPAQVFANSSPRTLREGSISVLWQLKVSRIAENPNARVLIRQRLMSLECDVSSICVMG